MTHRLPPRFARLASIDSFSIVSLIGVVMAMEEFDFSGLPKTITDRLRTARGEWSDFKGVLRWSEDELTYFGEGGSEFTTGYRLTLVHPDERNSLPLYESEEESDTYKLWRDVARALQLPVLYETGDGIVSRESEDLGKSLRQLAVEGKARVDFDLLAAPPKGMVWEVKEGYQRVTFGRKFFKRCIAISPSELRYEVRFSLEVIQLNELLSVDRYDSISSKFWHVYFLAGGWTSGQSARVQIGSIRFGIGNARISVGGLTDEQSHWLKKFILAAVIDAPKLSSAWSRLVPH